ncbi:hypothetical protein FACS1894161_3450 [Spirochaetia bacterium]|nr:hypothetical protein FACS1894161_3450 [Spirochaetia bacterium]
MIAVPVKNGMTVPTINDLKNFQLGYNRSNKRLYIRDDDKIIEFCQGIEYTPPSYDYIEITFDANGTAQLYNKWTGQPTYQLNDDPEIQLPDSNVATSIPVVIGDTIKIRGNFRSWRNDSFDSLVKGVSCHISKMPSMDYFTVDPEGTIAGDYFFQSFNYNGQLTQLPVGSFDTSKITTVGDYFFDYFNQDGQLTSLPNGSFDTSNILTVGSVFFSGFNAGGQLTSLPAGSFRLNPNLITVGSDFFKGFNDSGKLTSLPDGSFNTSNITTIGISFFYGFNTGGKIPKKATGGINIQNKYSGNIVAYYWNGTSTDSEYVSTGNYMTYQNS